MELTNAAADVTARLELLRLRYATFFTQQVGIVDSALCAVVADAYVQRLADGDEEVAAFIRMLIDPPELKSSAFWGTPFGRLIFAAGGYGEELVSQATVARVLGCSRQWVNELVGLGQLEVLRSASPPQVFVAHVRVLLKAKLDRLVN